MTSAADQPRADAQKSHHSVLEPPHVQQALEDLGRASSGLLL